MIKELGQVASILKNLPKMREEMERLQSRLGQVVAEGDAGGGMVKVRVNGRMEVTACQLSEEAVKSQDRELLEDLIKAASNQALQRVRELVAEETRKLTGGLSIPGSTESPG